MKNLLSSIMLNLFWNYFQFIVNFTFQESEDNDQNALLLLSLIRPQKEGPEEAINITVRRIESTVSLSNFIRRFLISGSNQRLMIRTVAKTIGTSAIIICSVRWEIFHPKYATSNLDENCSEMRILTVLQTTVINLLRSTRIILTLS